MFDPNDSLKGPARRSLLDLAPAEQTAPRKGTARPHLLRSAEAAAPPPPAAVAPVAFAAAVPPAETREPRNRRASDLPLIDLATIADSVWRLRRIVIATTVLGAVAGVGLALSTPNSYLAESKLYIDPREVRLTDSDLSKDTLATEAILALIDSQLEVLRSRTVLDKVATELALDRDPEFGSAARAAASSPPVAAAGSPAATEGAAPEPPSRVDPRTLDKLSEAITVSRDPKTFIVSISVKSRDPAKAAHIANSIVTTFFDEEQAAQSGFFQRTTAALDTRLEELRKELDQAESAVEDYKAKHDIVGAGGQLISDQTLLALNTQVAAARNRIAEARAKVNMASRTQLKDILTGAYPEEVASATLQQLRAQYAQARAQLSALDASLGPRHPQRLAASQAVDSARMEIDNELKRIGASTQTELSRAISTEQDLLRQLAVGKADQVNASSSFIELRELERKANATRTIYESFLKRASETGEEEKLSSKNIRVISKAEPPIKPTGLSRKVIVIGGVLAGFAAGIGLGVALGIVRSLTDSYRRARPPLPRDPAPAGPGGTRFEPEQSSDSVAPRRPQPVATTGFSPVVARKTGLDTAAASQPVMPHQPSAHHAGAAAAAFSALNPSLRANAERGREPDPAPDVQRLRSDLQALRRRVERYQGSRRSGRA
ncbi:GumC family protein [Rhizobium sp. YIM 134829]|uniref:GumC family protein n=1 Tax=Rhizobium sp. YIM 134829 TaxID=3390453 RepID=UPI00397C85FD